MLFVNCIHYCMSISNAFNYTQRTKLARAGQGLSGQGMSGKGMSGKGMSWQMQHAACTVSAVGRDMAVPHIYSSSVTRM